jgi:hypothetical protein
VGSGNNAIQNTNSYGTLVSNFDEMGDFTFSGTMTATLDSFNDNDIMGVVFGWQDSDNHYRLGWEGGGFNDEGTGASGMWLVEEVAGVDTVLFQVEVLWNDLIDYTFFVGREGNEISFNLGGESGTFTNTSFMNGAIGFYTESQTANFTGLASVPVPPSEVSAPTSLAILGLGLLGLASVRRKS